MILRPYVKYDFPPLFFCTINFFDSIFNHTPSYIYLQVLENNKTSSVTFHINSTGCVRSLPQSVDIEVLTNETFVVKNANLVDVNASLCAGAILLADLTIAGMFTYINSLSFSLIPLTHTHTHTCTCVGTVFEDIQVGTVANIDFNTMGLPSLFVPTLNLTGTGLGSSSRQTYWLCLYAQSNTPCEVTELTTENIYLSGINVLTLTDLYVSDFETSDLIIARLQFNGADQHDVYLDFELGQIVSIVETSSNMAYPVVSPLQITIFGTGFFSSSGSDYDIELSMVGDAATNLIVTNKSIPDKNHIIVEISPDSSLSGDISAVLNYQSQGQLASILVGKIMSVDSTRYSQTVYSAASQLVTIKSDHFVSRYDDFSDWIVTISDDDGMCTDLDTELVSALPETSLTLRVNLSSCNSSTPIVRANIRADWWRSSWGSIGPVDVAEILYLNTTSESQGFPTDTSLPINLALSGWGFGNESELLSVRFNASTPSNCVQLVGSMITVVSSSELSLSSTTSSCTGIIALEIQYGTLGWLGPVRLVLSLSLHFLYLLSRYLLSLTHTHTHTHTTQCGHDCKS